jgi:hypothetical protein
MLSKAALLPLIALACSHAETAFADEKPTSYRIMTTAYEFNDANNTYTFEVRFTANPCPAVNYNIPFRVSGVKDSDEAIARYQPQIDKIAADLAKDEEKHCPHSQ